MSTLINASIKTSELKKIDQNKIIKGEKDSYIPITISTLVFMRSVAKWGL